MFNWVHTKFHYNPLKDQNGSRKNNIESMRKEGKRQGLAKQVDEMADIVDDWRINGRRLTIFLMGFERSSKPRNYKPQYFNLKKELGKRDDHEIVDNIIVDNKFNDDELSPLMATTFPNNFDDQNGQFCTALFEKSQVVVAMERRHVVQVQSQSQSRSQSQSQRVLRGRVTLADLFMADADHGTALEKVVSQDLQKKFPGVEKPKVVAEPPATARNLLRVIRKMRKRKIHGEVEEEQLVGEKILYANVFQV